MKHRVFLLLLLSVVFACLFLFVFQNDKNVKYEIIKPTTRVEKIIIIKIQF